LEGVIWASNMISNLCYCKHFKAFLFSLIKFWTQYCNIISTANFVYVIYIYLIKYDLGCEVDLLKPLAVLNGLPGLYKWRYTRVNVFNGDGHTWSYINWAVLSQWPGSFSFPPSLSLLVLVWTQSRCWRFRRGTSLRRQCRRDQAPPRRLPSSCVESTTPFYLDFVRSFIHALLARVRDIGDFFNVCVCCFVGFDAYIRFRVVFVQLWCAV
jgi:hypothetical protein